MAETTDEAVPRRRRIRDPRRTRAVIVQALLECVRDGEVPTAKRLSARAGVSERSVFVHFRDLDDLRVAAAETQYEVIVAMLRPIDTTQPLDDRIHDLVSQRELIFPIQATRLVGLLEARRSEALAAWIARLDADLRAQVEHAFAAELDAWSGADREELLGALDATAGWGFRHHLCTSLDWSSRHASGTVRRSLLAMLRGGAW